MPETALDALAFVVLGVVGVGFTALAAHSVATDPELRVTLALSAGLAAVVWTVVWALCRVVALWAER